MKNHRIPNWWILAGLIIGVWLNGFYFLVSALLVTALFFVLFMCRMMGAGDIKLMALISGYLGLFHGFWAIGCGFLLGAAAAFIKLLCQRSLIQRLTYFHAYIRRLIHTKEITEYYRPDRDGYGATVYFACYLFLGTLCYMFIIR